jgi:hypothetical protein
MKDCNYVVRLAGAAALTAQNLHLWYCDKFGNDSTDWHIKIFPQWNPNHLYRTSDQLIIHLYVKNEDQYLEAALRWK